MSDRSVRIAGVAGIVFVVLILVSAFSAGGMPKPDDPVDKIRTFFVDHRSALLVSTFIGLLATPFVLFFGVNLRELVRGDRQANVFGTFSLAGLLVTAPMAAAGGVTSIVAVYDKAATARFSDDTIRLLFTMQGLFFTATASGIIAFALGAALALNRTRALPSHCVWLAYLAAVGNIVSAIAVLGAGASGIGFAGLATFSLFILVSGITMAIGKATPAVAS